MQTENSSVPWERKLSPVEEEAWAEGRLHIDPHRLVQALIQRGHEYATLDAAANVLEETKGSVLGQMVQAFMEQGKSATAAEHLAKASAMYRQHVAQMVAAREKALKAKVNYEAGQVFIELARTREATRRAEMKMGGHIT